MGYNMSMVGILLIIKEWFAGLDITGKIVETVVSFFTSNGLNQLWAWLNPPEEEKAFKRALKKWKKHFHLSGTYDKQRRLKSISDFCHYVIAHHGVYDQYIDSLQLSC